MRILALLLALLPLPALAQMVASDLNGDGRPERFSVIIHDGIADLQIENTGGGVVIAENTVWSGGIGQQPELSIAPNGSVLLTAMNESIGRNRWHQTLTIAFRRGTYMVAGYTYDWYDTLDLDQYGVCDVNLLNGKGELRVGNAPKQSFRTALRALPVTAWAEGTAPPECTY
jgi:hypothetical protein